jgi:hypothetical protein
MFAVVSAAASAFAAYMAWTVTSGVYNEPVQSALAKTEKEYVDRGIDQSLRYLSRMQSHRSLKELATEYARIADTEVKDNKDHEWTRHMLNAYTFWEAFVRQYQAYLTSGLLDDTWQFRAMDYLNYCEVMDAVSYYRRRLDASHPAGGQDYWDHRPMSYTLLSERLVAMGKRTKDDDAMACSSIQAVVKPTVLAIVSTAPLKPILSRSPTPSV